MCVHNAAFYGRLDVVQYLIMHCSVAVDVRGKVRLIGLCV